MCEWVASVTAGLCAAQVRWEGEGRMPSYYVCPEQCGAWAEKILRHIARVAGERHCRAVCRTGEVGTLVC